MSNFVNKIHFIQLYHRLNRHLLGNSTRSSISLVNFYGKDQTTSPDLNQFIAYQLSWKLSHQPPPPKISRNPYAKLETEKNDDHSSLEHWDSWFQNNLSSIFPVNNIFSDSTPSDLYFPNNRPGSISMSKRLRPESSLSSSSTRKSFRYDYHELALRNLPNRYWSTTNYQSDLERSHHQHFSFHIISYNILAQKLIEDNANLYDRCIDDDLYWSQRKHRLLREILHQNADIICLQEMQKSHYERDFQPKMNEYGYDSIYIKRSGDKSDGCCLFYRVNRLRLINSKTVPFYQRNIEILDRDNCGIIALFQPLTSTSSSQDLFCVATTHLLFSPKRGDIKLAQIQYFLAEIDRISLKNSQSNSYYPIIICGDFNAQPQSPLSRFLVDGHIKYDEYRRIEISGQIPSSMINHRFSLQLPSNSLLPPAFVTPECRFPHLIASMDEAQSIFHSNIAETSSATLTHNKRFHSVYDLEDPSKVTTRIDNDSSTVDYIFYTRSGGSGDRDRLKLLGRYNLYDKNMMDHIHLPNHQFASDHFLLAAKFALKLHKRKEHH